MRELSDTLPNIVTHLSLCAIRDINISSSKWKKSRLAVPSNRNYGFCLEGLKSGSVQKTRSSCSTRHAASLQQGLRKYVSMGSNKPQHLDTFKTDLLLVDRHSEIETHYSQI